MADVDDLCADAPVTVNHLIFAALERVVQDFLVHVVKRRAARFTSTEYTIYTNNLDSGLWFDDAELNRWFEHWRKA